MGPPKSLTFWIGCPNGLRSIDLIAGYRNRLGGQRVFRRFLTAVLIMGYLACQMATVPHAHAHQTADHDFRAHVHWDWFAGRSDGDATATPESSAHHGHVHRGDHHGHSHEQPSTPTPAEHNGSDHDATCVYVPHNAHVSAAAMASFPPCGKLATAIAACDYFASVDPRPSLSFHVPPEDSLIGGCALILRLRTLRI